MLIHVIQSGENLWLLSRRYGVGVDEIVAANELPDANRLTVGQALVIPLPPRHIVRPGDTLWQIARLYGTTVQALQQINRIPNPYMIQPGQTIQIPPKRKPTIDVNAFSIQFDETGAQEVRDIGRHLTYLTPFGYRIQRDGSLEAINDALLLQAAEQTRVVPIMAITNFSSQELGSEVAHTVLGSTELQDKLLSQIIDTMRRKNYRGLNVDFENVRPADREPYNQFLRRAVERLHAEHYFVSTSVAPKTSSAQKGLLYEAHDYEAQGRIVDFIVLMTYEWGYRFGPPQAISPIDQIRAVLDYATRVIPTQKLLMGFQLYARDWLLPHVQGQEAETFSVQEAFRRATEHGAAIQYDTRTQSPYFRYTDGQGRAHEVWFEDARSAQAKFNLVKEYQLKGISYWVLGYPFPQNWLLLEDNFRVRKR